MALKYLNLTGLTDLVTNIMNWVTSRIPTKTSEIDNDSGYITASDLPTNHVTTDTSQTISGAKTLTNNLYFNANTHRIIYMNNTAWTMGEAIPSSTKYIGSLVHRCNGTDCSYIDTRRDTTGNVYQQHGVKWKFTNGATATNGTAIESVFAHGLTANGTRYVYWNGYLHNINVVPITNNNNSLGDATHRWTNVYGTVRLDPSAGATADLLYSQMAANDLFRLQVGGTSNNGYVEIATADDGNEPIYVRQYKGVFATLQRTLTLLDGSGNTTLPGTLNAVSYKLNGTAFGDIVTHNASEYASSSHTHTVADVSNFPTLATVATSGSYNDLSDKPTIPTVNNATLTIQKNGTTVKTFTANASSNVTANITVPTKTSELTNDSGFLTSHQSLSNYVTLNGSQTITGAKTFTGGVILSSTAKMTVNHATVVKGTNPSSVQYWQIFNCDKNGASWGTNTLSIIEGALDANGKSSIYFRACKNEANSTASGTLSVVYDLATNKTWAECPTPDANSNNTKIATTAWVTAKGYLTSHQSLDGKMTRGSYERIAGDSSNYKDLNDYITAGFYNIKTAYVNNCPTGIGRDAVLLVYPWNAGSYCTQEITESAASTYTRRWIRKLNNTTWSDWVAVAFHGDNISAFNNDSGYLTSHQSLSNYSTLANTVKSLSISDKTITVTPGSGSAYTLTTQDTVYTHPTTSGNKHIPSGGSSGQFLGWDSDGTAKWVNNPNTNTDTLVKQNVSTANNTYPILIAATNNATANLGAKEAYFGSGVKINPSTSTIFATTFSGALTGNVTGNCSGSSGSCTGNAATATQFSANKSVTLTGDVTGTASSKAGWSVATTLADSGVTAGTYGPSADVTGNNNSTISVPQITVDAKGRVTSVVNKTLTCKNNTYNVYNKTLTIQKNGTNVATFTSNSNTDVTANIVVPTKISDLTNDSNFVTSNNVSSAINSVVIAEVNPGYFTVTQNRLDNAHATSAFAISPTLCLPSVGVSNAYDIDTTNWNVSGGDIHVVVQDANSKTVPGYVMIYLSKCAATDFVIIQLTSMARSAGIYVPTIKSGSNYYVKACFPTSGDFYVNIVKTAGTIGYAKLYPFLGNFGFVAPS